MIRIKILSIGKTKEKWLEEAFQEYVKRLKSTVEIETHWAKDNAQLIEWARKEPVCLSLDPAGKSMTSEQFSDFLSRAWEQGGSRLALIIGGAEGLPPILRKEECLISLSPLTFTHQLTRLILIEQIYRALEIKKGSNYHK